VPVNYSGYSPENYDSRYRGAVSAREALVQSLNVPAVNLCAGLGDDGIYDFLRRAGLSTLTNPKEHYGLSLILGGCEVTLLELTNLYAGLANGGSFRECRLLMADENGEERQLLTPEACYILSDILSELRRPDLPSAWEWSVDMPKVAWKTGTSYGRRDAWSIGYTRRFSVGVWVGNFDGRGVPELVGADAAAPVLFGIISALESRSKSEWFREPDRVRYRQVCSESGMPMSSCCSSAKGELYVPGVSPHRECTLHRSVLIDSETGYRLCRHCCRGRAYEERIVEEWPAAIATWLERNGYPIDRIPEHHPGCPRILAGHAPIINSPVTGCEYKLRRDVHPDYQKILLDASVSNRSSRVFWFLNGELIFSGSPVEKVFIDPKPGSHLVVCSDDHGRSSEARFTVK
jgi:penicillin-binding protein 1C